MSEAVYAGGRQPTRLSLALGCYDTDRGLQLASEEHDGTWRIAPGPSGARNVSHAVWSARHRKLYAVREEDEGAIDVIVPGETWRLQASVPTLGSQPCHCALDPTEQYLAAANYGSGDVVVFSLRGDGMPAPDPWQQMGSGSGPDPERQEGPHAHWVGFSPDRRWLMQTDLGADVVRAFRFDPERGPQGQGQVAFQAPPGSGPRWMHFGLPGADALLVSELDSTLSVHTWADGRLIERERRSTRGVGAEGANLAGHLAVNDRGDRVFVTNRGDDTVSLFALENGSLDLLSTVSSGGRSPRYLCLIEARDLLLVGHEEEGAVTVFDLSPAEPRPAGRIEIENVAWIGRGFDPARRHDEGKSIG